MRVCVCVCGGGVASTVSRFWNSALAQTTSPRNLRSDPVRHRSFPSLFQTVEIKVPFTPVGNVDGVESVHVWEQRGVWKLLHLPIKLFVNLKLL